MDERRKERGGGEEAHKRVNPGQWKEDVEFGGGEKAARERETE